MGETMRQLKQLSHSGFSLHEKNPDEFYLKYLSERRSPRVPQERPAAAGASFDAYVKAHLRHDLDLGRFDDLFAHYFESQVEPQNRDWALDEGRYIYECYVLSGFYAELVKLLRESSVAAPLRVHRGSRPERRPLPRQA